jgi:hypothetical protein
MKYMLNIYGDMSAYDDLTPEQNAEIMQAYDAFWREASDKGVILAGEGLQGPETATAVKVRNGERMVTDGPFAETKEQLGGFYLLECKDLDEAIEWAAKIPGAQNGTIEVRPVMNYDQ